MPQNQFEANKTIPGNVFIVDLFKIFLGLKISPIWVLQAYFRKFKMLFQKQPFRGVLRKTCCKNMQQIYRKAPMSKCEIVLRHGFSPVNLLHIFRIPSPQNISGRLLLIFVFSSSHTLKKMPSQCKKSSANHYGAPLRKKDGFCKYFSIFCEHRSISCEHFSIFCKHFSIFRKHFSIFCDQIQKEV